MSRLSELYFLHSMLEGTRIDPGLSFTNQLLTAATSSAMRIVNLINPIVRSVRIEPKPDDRVSGSEILALAAFVMEGGRICWIYHGNRLMPHPNVDHTTLLNPYILSFMLSD